MKPPGRSTDSGNGPASITTLSVFMVLLVFFAVLGAHSQWRSSRTEPVLRSVGQQFGGVAAQTEGPASAAMQAARAAIRAVGDLLGREFPIAKVSSEGAGTVWHVEVPADDLFRSGSTDLRQERVGLLYRIARTLEDPPLGVHYRVGVFMAIAGSLREGPGSVARAIELGRSLLDGGTPVSGLAIGLEAGNPGTVRFYFAVEPDEETPQ